MSLPRGFPGIREVMCRYFIPGYQNSCFDLKYIKNLCVYEVGSGFFLKLTIKKKTYKSYSFPFQIRRILKGKSIQQRAPPY